MRRLLPIIAFLTILLAVPAQAAEFNSRNQRRSSSLDTDGLARFQILKDTANKLLERYQRKSKVRRLDDFSE